MKEGVAIPDERHTVRIGEPRPFETALNWFREYYTRKGAGDLRSNGVEARREGLQRDLLRQRDGSNLTSFY